MSRRELQKRVVVLGGGYAGLSAILDLAGTSRFDILLIDRNPAFLLLTQLHKTVHTDPDRLRISYASLARDHGFEFHCSALDFDGERLAEWQTNKRIAGIDIPFDYLIVATGAAAYPLENNSPPELVGRGLFTLDWLKHSGAAGVVEELLHEPDPGKRGLSIVGGGPSGIQFLFELDDFLRLRRTPCRINFVNLEERLLDGLPASVHAYVERKIRARRGTIRYLPRTRFIAQTEDGIELEDLADGKRFVLPSRLSLLFPGVAPQPLALAANRFGQIRHGEQALPAVFGAGDCTAFEGRGLNALSAQAAVRKGRAVAENIRRHAGDLPLLAYDYREIGYFVSLGNLDGAGWMLSEHNVLTGIPAFAIKEAVEARFAFFLEEPGHRCATRPG